jgi:hypothetical protein
MVRPFGTIGPVEDVHFDSVPATSDPVLVRSRVHFRRMCFLARCGPLWQPTAIAREMDLRRCIDLDPVVGAQT